MPQHSQAWELFVANHKKGDVVCGITIRQEGGMNRFATAAIIDLGGVEGSIHAREVPWSSFPWLPREGDKVYCPIIRFDVDAMKVELGGPIWNWEEWQTVEERFPTGTRHRGRVTGLARFGAFVHLAKGIDGLVELSELQRAQMIDHPSELFVEGEEIEVVVLDFIRNKVFR